MVGMAFFGTIYASMVFCLHVGCAAVHGGYVAAGGYLVLLHGLALYRDTLLLYDGWDYSAATCHSGV
jgi:hypothetical protein